MLTTLVSPRQLGNSLFFGVCRASSRPQHQLSQKLSFQGIGRFCAFFQLVLPMLFRNTDERVRGRLSLRVSCGAFLQGRFSSPVDEEGGWQARLAEANPPCRFRLPSPSGTCVRAGNAHRVCEGCLAKRRIRTAPEMFHVKHFDDRRMQPAPPQAESRTAATSRRPRRRKPQAPPAPQAAAPFAVRDPSRATHPTPAGRQISRMIWRSVSSFSRSSRFSFIFSSTLVTEYMTVEWSRLNFFPMSLKGRSSICRHR